MQAITTDRLTIRPLALDDAPFILTLFNQPDCIRFIGDKNLHTIEDAKNYIINGPQTSYREHGFGLLAVCLHSGETVGLCGLLKRDEYELPDLGYAILTDYYRQGIALESCQAVLAQYNDKKRLLAMTHPENKGSQVVLEKLGFKFDRTIENEEKQSVTNCYLLAR